MAEFQTIDFMTPIVRLVEQYPDLKSSGPVAMIPLRPEIAPESNAMAYMGTTRPTRRKDTIGNVYSARQANFILYVKRMLTTENKNLQLANIIYNFEQWVEFMDIKNKVPRFSTDEDFPELMWADNGFIWNVVDNISGVIPFVQYQIQIHIQYALLYESGGF